MDITPRYRLKPPIFSGSFVFLPERVGVKTSPRVLSCHCFAVSGLLTTVNPETGFGDPTNPFGLHYIFSVLFSALAVLDLRPLAHLDNFKIIFLLALQGPTTDFWSGDFP